MRVPRRHQHCSTGCDVDVAVDGGTVTPMSRHMPVCILNWRITIVTLPSIKPPKPAVDCRLFDAWNAVPYGVFCDMKMQFDEVVVMSALCRSAERYTTPPGSIASSRLVVTCTFGIGLPSESSTTPITSPLLGNSISPSASTISASESFEIRVPVASIAGGGVS